MTDPSRPATGPCFSPCARISRRNDKRDVREREREREKYFACEKKDLLSNDSTSNPGAACGVLANFNSLCEFQ
jgi:hypothetical protein